jgi:hypothetical protein
VLLREHQRGILNTMSNLFRVSNIADKPHDYSSGTGNPGQDPFTSGIDPVSGKFIGTQALNQERSNPNLIPFGNNDNAQINVLSATRDKAVKEQYKDVLASTRMLGARANRTGAM